MKKKKNGSRGWQISIWKDAQYYMSLGNCNWKQQWHVNTHLLQWLKSQTLTPNAGEGVVQQDLHRFWWEYKTAQPLQDNLAVSYKTSHKKTWRKPTCILLSGRSRYDKSTLLYYLNYMILWKRQNYGDSKKISGCQKCWGRRREGKSKRSVGDFRAVWSTVAKTIQWKVDEELYYYMYSSIMSTIFEPIDWHPASCPSWCDTTGGTLHCAWSIFVQINKPIF